MIPLPRRRTPASGFRWTRLILAAAFLGATWIAHSDARASETPPTADGGGGGINLSWDDCGLMGGELKTFACNTSIGAPFTLVASFEPPAMMPEFLGLTADVRFTTAGDLPDWWKHGASLCRGTTGLSVGFDFTAGPFNCADFFVGAAAGGFDYVPDLEGSDQARLRVTCAVPFDIRGAIDPGVEYYAFKVLLLRSRTTGTGSCAGCDRPVLATLREIQLYQPSFLGYDPVLTEARDRAFARWQGHLVPPIVISTVSPGAGSPGTPVTIEGRGFSDANGVRFVETAATFTVASDSVIHTNVPALAHSGAIRVVSPTRGTAISASSFIVSPMVQSFAPAQAPVGHEVRIAGYNFTGATAVAFHGTPATFTVVGDGEIRAPVPAGATDGPISVTNAGGTGASATSFLVGALPPPPVVTSFAPAGGGPGLTVTITGEHFLGVTSVLFGTEPAAYTVPSPTRIDAVVPAGARTGLIQVATTEGAGASDDLFIVRPTIDAIVPSRAPVGHTVEILGRNFTQTLAVRFQGVDATFEEHSDDRLTAVVPEGATTGPVEVENAGGVGALDFTLGPVPTSGINLAWDDCGAAGSIHKDFACSSNTGPPFSIVGSFSPPSGIEEFLGIEANLVVSTESAALPDWWRHGSGQCRGTSGLSTSFDFVTGPTTCTDFYHGAAVGGFLYDLTTMGPDRALLKLQSAVPFDQRGPVLPENEYYAFKVNLLRGRTTGTGACAGCDEPVSIRLLSIQLFQPPKRANDPILDVPLWNTTVQWQSGGPGAAARIISFAPASGSAGTLVTIRGQGFTGATSVKFATRSATFDVVSDSVVVATAPPGVGRGPIELTSPLGTAVSDLFFNADLTPPAGNGGINLSWNDCGEAGSRIEQFACDTNEGPPFVLVASFGAPPGIEEFLGLSSTLDLRTSGTPSPTDWWKHGTGYCRGSSALSVSADFTAGPYTCADPWNGAAAGGFVYEYPGNTPERARLRVLFSLPFENRHPLGDFEYFAYKIQIDRTKSTGTGSCAGCATPACIVLEHIQLAQPPERNNDPTISHPDWADYVSWQQLEPSCPALTPTLASVVDVDARAERVIVVWQTHAVTQAVVYRRQGSGAWRSLATVATDGLNRVTYEDREVTPGARYSYRLGVTRGATEEFIAETEVTVPKSERLELSRVVARSSGLAMSLSLPSTAPARVDVYDLVGRRWATRTLVPEAAGTLEIEVRGAQALRAGVYFVRLSQGAQTVSRRTVFVP